ncbi:hypothetical protein [Pararhizobium qamdonense]|uniref:hypothetical protein n=1 Tax=Pararhizobium qamdonense TaxID=3031126 RepID=UPI0023E1AF24|nr:hypothetical protein [Pararhizobium qamdonense]
MLPALVVVSDPAVANAVAETVMNVRLLKLVIGRVLYHGLSDGLDRHYGARAAFTEEAGLRMYCSQPVDNRLRPHGRL